MCLALASPLIPTRPRRHQVSLCETDASSADRKRTEETSQSEHDGICIDLENFTGSLRVVSRSNLASATGCNSALAFDLSNGGRSNDRETPKPANSTGILRSSDSKRTNSARSEASAEPQFNNSHEANKIRGIIENWSSEVGKSPLDDSVISDQVHTPGPSSVSFADDSISSEQIREAAQHTVDQTDNDINPGNPSRGSRRGGIIAKTDSERASCLGTVEESASSTDSAAPDSNGNALDSKGAPPSSMAKRLGMSSSTKLHMVCSRPDANLSQLQKILQENVSCASRRDPFGRHPLHILAENEALAASVPTEEMIRFLKELLDANPEAVLAKDIDGQLPFVATIVGWVDSVHTPLEEGEEQSFHGLESSFTTESQHRDFHEASPSLRIFNYVFPRDVIIPAYVLWSLRMLSVAMDHLTPTPGSALWRQRSVSVNLRWSMAEQTASSVPFLCKTLLVVADEEEADAVFSTSLLRTMLLNPDLVGYWLISMIRANRARAVDFLERVSNVTVGDMVGRKRGFSKEEVGSFVMRRKRVFDAVAGLEGLVPSMLALNAQAVERAASTRVITYVLDTAVKDPVSLGFMLFDLILEIILVLSYRIFVDGENLVGDVVRGCGLMSLTISVYFLLREGLTAISMISASRTMFNKFLRDFWTINDILSMSLTMISCACKISGINAPALFAFTIGFLWLKVLGTLKTLNMYLATLVLALVEIVKDARWFLLIMGLCIIMFADMLEIISKNSGLCDSDTESGRRLDAQGDFCSPFILDSYARIYAVLVGDVNLEDFQQSGTVTFLFVFFTFFGILILTSVLIAIVEDAYSRAKIRSFALFGRARVEYVARQQIRERFLKPVAERASFCSREYFTQLSRRLIRCGVGLSVVAVVVFVGTMLVITISECHKAHLVHILHGIVLL
mmetsp:Transcript_9060/g.20330  ORF Transcript_9060/g.20330 Transcript_9060/m.20330 type:complete len:910 (-) Transcript_9060:557-3286(-)